MSQRLVWKSMKVLYLANLLQTALVTYKLTPQEKTWTRS